MILGTFWKRRYVDVLGVSVVSAALAFSLACNKSGNKSDTKTEKGDDKSETKSQKADVTVDAKDILKDYEANEVSADTKYKDKIVEVSGVVGEIKKDFTDDIYVTVGTGKEFEFPLVQVYFEGDATKKASALKKGDKIKVKGKVTGLMLNVQLKDAVFVD